MPPLPFSRLLPLTQPCAVIALLFLATPAFAGLLTVQSDDTRLVVIKENRPLLTYRYNKVPRKPYVEELYTPSGKNVLRDAPSDHLHHHGLMFAIAVDGTNFWEEHGTPGEERHKLFTFVGTNDSGETERALWTEAIEWVAPDGKVVLLEDRKIEVLEWPGMAPTLACWESRFTLPEGKQAAKLTGSNYFGLGMRFRVEMDGGQGFLNAGGATGVDGTVGQRAEWCSYSATLDGASVTVAIFDSPESFRYPATWYTMNDPFSYLSATRDLVHSPQDMGPGDSLLLSHGIAVWDGQPDPVEIEKVLRKWRDCSH
jgi:hypothetical protein